MPSDQRLRLTEAKIERAFCRRHRHRWRHQSLDGANCTGCGDVTRVTPLMIYRERIVQAARQRGWGAFGTPGAGLCVPKTLSKLMT